MYISILYLVFFTLYYRNQKKILLYSNLLTRPRIFLAISTAAGIQFIFWSFLTFKAIIDFKQQQNKKSSLKWRVGLSSVSLCVGTLFTYTALMYPLRTVNKMVFNMNRSTIEISTYTPFGRTYVKEVSCYYNTLFLNL